MADGDDNNGDKRLFRDGVPVIPVTLADLPTSGNTPCCFNCRHRFDCYCTHHGQIIHLTDSCANFVPF